MSEPRRPVFYLKIPSGPKCVVCNDGSVFRYAEHIEKGKGKGWLRMPPIPGTPADVEKEKNREP